MTIQSKGKTYGLLFFVINKCVYAVFIFSLLFFSFLRLVIIILFKVFFYDGARARSRVCVCLIVRPKLWRIE